MTEFLFHKISEQEKEKIKKDSKKIMDSFSKKLSKIPTSKLKEIKLEKREFERTENTKDKLNIDREIMFENAPNKNKDFLIAEKKKW